MDYYFSLPLSEEGSDYLDSLGIKEHAIGWIQMIKKFTKELWILDEDDELIQRFKLILDRLNFLD